ncbi:MAG: hypothetical protein DCC64_05020 [Planctomycetota bacterium]|nr:MAG: hypothetical protein DCC64_05020 [Planctomycetota bacterium]
MKQAFDLNNTNQLQTGSIPDGWPNDVLQGLRRPGRKEFRLQDVYSFRAELASLHPGNNHFEDNIRQQLQVLRDAGLVEFLNQRGTIGCLDGHQKGAGRLHVRR